MVICCCICKNRALRKGPKRSYFRIPSVITHLGHQREELTTHRRLTWIRNLPLGTTVKDSSRVCSDHFITGRPSDLYDTIHPDWAPTVKLTQTEFNENVNEDTSITRDESLSKPKSNECQTHEHKLTSTTELDVISPILADPVEAAGESQIIDSNLYDHSYSNSISDNVFDLEGACAQDHSYFNLNSIDDIAVDDVEGARKIDHSYPVTDSNSLCTNAIDDHVVDHSYSFYHLNSSDYVVVDDVEGACKIDHSYTVTDSNSRRTNAVDDRVVDPPYSSKSEYDLNMEIMSIRMDNLELKKENSRLKFTKDTFKNNDRVKFFTGLPTYDCFISIFEYLEPHIPDHVNCKLTKFQKVLVVLMKLRLGLTEQDLAYKFEVSISTISRTFISILHVMYQRLKGLIYWPDREQLRQTMPLQFRQHYDLKVAVVIDCFELFIDRPSNLLARAQTWSQYKHHNTIKYLIGITPQGTISFLSDAWGGRTSDKHLTNNSGFLDLLLPGDLVLADRGFDIQESVGLMCAEVKIPAFTKGKPQLPALEVESTRKIANVRIHVERVIGLARNKYTILKKILPIDYLITCNEDSIPLIDKIVTVSCALTNCCPSIVIFD